MALDLTQIKFRDNVEIDSNAPLELNCIQFCAVFLANKYSLPIPKFPKNIYPIKWYYNSIPVLVNSVKDFFSLNNFLISRIFLTGNITPPNDSILLFRLPGYAHLHHAGIIQDCHILHCQPPKGVCKNIYNKRIWERGAIALEVKLWD